MADTERDMAARRLLSALIVQRSALPRLSVGRMQIACRMPMSHMPRRDMRGATRRMSRRSDAPALIRCVVFVSGAFHTCGGGGLACEQPRHWWAA